MWIKAITDKNKDNYVKREIIILWVKYSIHKYWPKIYIFDETFFTPAKWLLKIHSWEQVYDIEELNKITKEWLFPVYRFKYYKSDWHWWEILVYTEDWKEFKELWAKDTVNKPVETPVEQEVWKRKWLVKRALNKVMHPRKK